MRRRTAVCGLALALSLAATAGCGSQGKHAPDNLYRPGSSQSGNSSPSHEDATPSPVILPDIVDLKGSDTPAGAMLKSTAGKGKSDVSLAALAKKSRRVTIRFVCSGQGQAKVTDSSGGFILNVAGCDGTSVYTTGFRSSTADGLIHLSVGQSVGWRFAIWAV
ncbi:hypothetical protein OG762_14485 [Streptomyces sp. NBC_01136]|uniref:hypothetical protein n=1 Tax=unclassified Streptomyces TaxID=2593676 RepID=UPI0032436A6A|nr:hypothetical protein OG762_14485 [Streptomyces sp. NBC_01136]